VLEKLFIIETPTAGSTIMRELTGRQIGYGWYMMIWCGVMLECVWIELERHRVTRVGRKILKILSKRNAIGQESSSAQLNRYRELLLYLLEQRNQPNRSNRTFFRVRSRLAVIHAYST
jgi:hypothetical protein